MNELSTVLHCLIKEELINHSATKKSVKKESAHSYQSALCNLEDIFPKEYIEQSTKDSMWLYGGKQVSYLDNVVQIDSAKVNLHIFQDKEDCKKNYLGKKVEHNGERRIQKMSDAMDLHTAREKLKQNIHRDSERALQQSFNKSKLEMSNSWTPRRIQTKRNSFSGSVIYEIG